MGGGGREKITRELRFIILQLANCKHMSPSLAMARSKWALIYDGGALPNKLALLCAVKETD